MEKKMLSIEDYRLTKDAFFKKLSHCIYKVRKTIPSSMLKVKHFNIHFMCYILFSNLQVNLRYESYCQTYWRWH